MDQQAFVSYDIATPPGPGGFVAGLLAEQPVPAAAARLGAWFGAAFGRPIRIGRNVVVARHKQVTEALSRDLDFRIAPINQDRMEEVNGPFILGMDRSATLVHERKALYRALAKVDIAALHIAAARQASDLIDAAGAEIDVVGGYARLVAAGTAQRLFGVTGSDSVTFMDAARAIFAHVFLNIGGDKAVEARAVRASLLMHDWLKNEIERRRAGGDLGSDLMGTLLALGDLDDDGVRRTLGGMLVGAIDTTASSVAKIVAMVGRDPAFGRNVAADRANPERFAGWCWEAMRRWPHNPVVLRQAQTDTSLGGTRIRKGDRVVLWTQAAMQDPSFFPDPGKWRADRPARAYLHFGGGLHPCAGRVVNDYQIPLLAGALVRRGIRSVGPVGWAGPFPDRMIVTFRR
jgi:cytochrome P450